MNIKFSKEVENALAEKAPIVALESTVIAHGLPYPQNLETALRMEEIVREQGATPATIAVFDGEFCVGLSDEQINHLATDQSVQKISTRDLPIAVSKKLTCATTVATTMFIAHRAGIKTFATGGIGGVHRGFSADVSADLPALASTPMTVVCSGAKIVLDLPATREWLETFGVTIIGYGCDEMPAFYSSRIGLTVDQKVESADEIVEIAKARDELGLDSALLVTVPVPIDFEIELETLEGILAKSMELANQQGVAGNEITPFLLSAMSKFSKGKTLDANVALLVNNAKIAAQIAVASNN